MDIKDFEKNISLAKHTSFGIGGEAKYFFIAKTKEDVVEALRAAKKNKLRMFVLSGGSNVLALDKGFNGLVVKIKNVNFKING